MAIQLRTMLSELGPGGDARVSVRGVLAAHGFTPPVSLRELAGLLTPVRFRMRITPGTLDGWCEVAAWPDGRIDYSGHVHNSGLADIRYSVITSMPVALPEGPLLLSWQGFTGGTLGPLSRDDDWRQGGRSDLVRGHWPAFVAATTGARTEAAASIGATELFTTAFGGGTGTWVLGLPG